MNGWADILHRDPTVSDQTHTWSNIKMHGIIKSNHKKSYTHLVNFTYHILTTYTLDSYGRIKYVRAVLP